MEIKINFGSYIKNLILNKKDFDKIRKNKIQSKLDKYNLIKEY